MRIFAVPRFIRSRGTAYYVWSAISSISNLNQILVLEVSFAMFRWKETKEIEIGDADGMTLQMQ